MLTKKNKRMVRKMKKYIKTFPVSYTHLTLPTNSLV